MHSFYVVTAKYHYYDHNKMYIFYNLVFCSNKKNYWTGVHLWYTNMYSYCCHYLTMWGNHSIYYFSLYSINRHFFILFYLAHILFHTAPLSFLRSPLPVLPLTTISIDLFVTWLAYLRITCPHLSKLPLINLYVTGTTFEYVMIYLF